MKKHFYFPFVAALSLGLVASSCSDSKDDEKKEENPSKTDDTAKTPKAFMFYNEFVQDGGVLKVKGENFTANTVVEFQGKDGAAIAATKVECKSANEIWATVPAGVAESSFVTFKNGDKTSECAIRLRDTRNMLVDFNSEKSLALTFMSGDVDKAVDGTYAVTANAEIGDNYSSNGANQYGLFTDEDAWKGISYAPSASEDDLFAEDGSNSVLGSFAKEIAKNPASLNDYVVKFEINVPKSGALDGLGVALAFTSAAEKEMTNGRKFAACFQPAEIVFDKTTDEEGKTSWSLSSYKKFSTDGWMTVAVPMSEFVWNLYDNNYLTIPEVVGQGWEIPEDMAGVYAAGGKSYAEVNASKVATPDDLFDAWGGLQLLVNNYDFGSSGNGKKGTLAVDNVRIVPNDGNGAIYPKAGFGVPSQHYELAPRTAEFK